MNNQEETEKIAQALEISSNITYLPCRIIIIHKKCAFSKVTNITVESKEMIPIVTHDIMKNYNDSDAYDIKYVDIKDIEMVSKDFNSSKKPEKKAEVVQSENKKVDIPDLTYDHYRKAIKQLYGVNKEGCLGRYCLDDTCDEEHFERHVECKYSNRNMCNNGMQCTFWHSLDQMERDVKKKPSANFVNSFKPPEMKLTDYLKLIINSGVIVKCFRKKYSDIYDIRYAPQQY